MTFEFILIALLIIAGFTVLIVMQKRLYEARKQSDIEDVVDRVFGMSAQKVAEQSKHILEGEKEAIKTDLANKHQMIEKLVKDLQRDIVTRQEEIRKIEQDRVEKFSEIKKQLETQREVTNDLKVSTEQLSKVLSNNQARGAWGERIIEDLLTSHGLQEGIHYERQKVLGESTLKPDITLLLPNKRVVAVDVKFPYSEMQKMADAQSKVAQDSHLKQFEQDLKKKIDKVAEYIHPEFNTLDYAIMFVPNEMIFSFINQKVSHLVDYALQKRVLLVSPFTFLIVARTVMESYRNFMIGDRLKEVIQHVDQFSMEWDKFMGALDKYGRAIKTLQTSYDELSGTRVRQMQKRMDSVRSYSSGSLLESETE
ncbi:MAG: DNA recombination protein RmuC [Pseudomonadales bacterium]|nr:DNA recombination protein RmuC [Candidatus Woesebacteria bacterium]MCB9800917.1 DNA recombination protein RmuC [Pseudomonadales bacterium]